MTVMAASTAQPWRVSLTIVAERVAEGGGDQQDREHLEEVRERRRVLERVRGVHVEEAAAVGAELLDRDLRGRGPQREDLLGDAALPSGVRDRLVVLGQLDDRDLRVGAKCLHHALRDQDQREDDRERQQDVERGPGQVDPEVADGARRSARAKPRMSATSVAMPAAADTKFCTVSPSICVR